jgi:predicted O-methyltransferase YrrM
MKGRGVLDSGFQQYARPLVAQAFRPANGGAGSPEGLRYARRRWSCSVGAVLAIVLCAVATVDAQPPDVTRLLQQIKTADTEQLAVSEEDGRFLRVMVAASRATRILEIGGAYGYSAIWIGLGLSETGGRLTSIEFDPERAKVAAANIRTAGLADIVTVLSGDAFTEVPKMSGAFDLVFVDAWKRDYKRFLDLLLPRLAPRGLLLAHNVVNKESEMRDFLAAIKNDPRLLTTIVAPAGEGISVSYKRP